MSLIHNERTKLTANWFNTLATALVATGVIAPVAAKLYGLPGPAIEDVVLGALCLGCFVAGVALHWFARAILGGLRE